VQMGLDSDRQQLKGMLRSFAVRYIETLACLNCILERLPVGRVPDAVVSHPHTGPSKQSHVQAIVRTLTAPNSAAAGRW
jgi:hypothetical protein